MCKNNKKFQFINKLAILFRRWNVNGTTARRFKIAWRLISLTLECRCKPSIHRPYVSSRYARFLFLQSD